MQLRIDKHSDTEFDFYYEQEEKPADIVEETRKVIRVLDEATDALMLERKRIETAHRRGRYKIKIQAGG